MTQAEYADYAWESLPAPPVVEPIRRLADEALADFARALHLIRTRADQLFACHEEIACQRLRIEKRTVELDRRIASLEERELQMTQRMNDFDVRGQAIEERDLALTEEFSKVRESREALDAERVLFAEQISKLETEQASLSKSKVEVQELHSRMLEREEEFIVRDREIGEQESRLRQQVSEIEAMRENMTVLSSQLERDRGELVKQRSELVSRFSATPGGSGSEAGGEAAMESAVASSPNMVDGVGVGQEVREEHSFEMPDIDIASPKPKPAQQVDNNGEGVRPTGVADQFRKLRRDAKRRMKGLV